MERNAFTVWLDCVSVQPHLTSPHPQSGQMLSTAAAEMPKHAWPEPTTAVVEK